MTRLGQLWALLCVLLLPAVVWAQPSLRTQVSTRTPAVGETFTVQLIALVDSGTALPANARLSVPPGLTAHGPSVGSQSQVSIMGGQIQSRSGIGATWSVTASRPGTYRLGPASVSVAGKVYSDAPVTVEVQTQRSQGQRRPFDPFDPFSFPGLPRIPGLTDSEPDAEELFDLLPPYPPEMRLQRAADPIAFVHTVVSPQRAVVGEQVTLTVYAYGRRGPFRETFTSEPSREAFLTFTLLENSYTEPLYQVPVDDTVWHAKKVREMALFPIKSGSLTIGAMRMGFEGRNYPSEGRHKGLVRYSSPVDVTVVEPPTAARPAGYTIGDVGRYTLTATVSPREVSAGEAVSVVAKIEGTGNVPFALKTPQQHGVEWLDPSHTEKIEPRGTSIGGHRRFSYVVRLDEPGDVDLGELSLPYWNPERSRYETARANLGRVTVRPDPSRPAATESTETDALKGLLTPRAELQPDPSGPRTPLSEQPWFLALLLAGPVLVLTARATATATGKLRTSIETRRDSLAEQARRSLQAASRAERDGEHATAASRAESALFFAIEHATDLKARAILRDELTQRLIEGGLPESLSQRVVECLGRCDAARFTSEDGAEIASDAEPLVRELTTRPSRATPRSAA